MKAKFVILLIALFTSWMVLQSFTVDPLVAKGKYECQATQTSLNNFNENFMSSSCFIGVNGAEDGGSRISPSNRKKDHWEMTYEEDEINTWKREEMDYTSTIKKIREVEIKNNFEVKKTWIQKITEEDHMEIFISGGGYRGGINPVLNDRITISNSNLLQKYYETEVGGVKKSSKKVDREELTELIKWIAEKGFFAFENEYSCENTNSKCQTRLNQRPKPIPLKIVVAVGQYRNVVSVPIFAPDINREEYINYPDELKKIVEAIYVFASL